MDHRVVVHGTSLEHGEGADELGSPLDVLQQHDVVRQVREPLLGDSPQLEQLGDLDDHHHADSGAFQPLGEREHPLAKPGRVGGRDHHVWKAFYVDPSCAELPDQHHLLLVPPVYVSIAPHPTVYLDTPIITAPTNTPYYTLLS